MAGRFTAADIVIGYALRLAENIGLAKDFGPNVAAYWQRLQQRDGFKRAVAAENLAGVAAEGRAAFLKRPRRPRKSSESPVFPDVCVGDIRRDCCILLQRSMREPAPDAARSKDRSREGRTMNDDDRRESGRLMLISPERVFYAGLLGRPRKRAGGGFSIYAAMQGSLKITEGKSETVGEVAVVPPYVTHSVESEHPSIICLVIEPETVEPAALVALSSKNFRDGIARHRATNPGGLRDLAPSAAAWRLYHRRIRPGWFLARS